ncbi:hypothetical protein [Floricoccus penangensis]|uniref:hypothetical protein n=1 Tax=Floricoccus penangensis TaxID=1859475 RepID=UPI00203D6E37|nr:hypothetical protein [Floricoccus penangensis]URZ88206.1 hypothetical protein KIW23_03995 [Floricoccus penangensis]
MKFDDIDLIDCFTSYESYYLDPNYDGVNIYEESRLYSRKYDDIELSMFINIFEDRVNVKVKYKSICISELFLEGVNEIIKVDNELKFIIWKDNNEYLKICIGKINFDKFFLVDNLDDNNYL